MSTTTSNPTDAPPERLWIDKSDLASPRPRQAWYATPYDDNNQSVEYVRADLAAPSASTGQGEDWQTRAKSYEAQLVELAEWLRSEFRVEPNRLVTNDEWPNTLVGVAKRVITEARDTTPSPAPDEGELAPG